MADLLNVLKDKLSGKNVKIVLPEGEDERVLTAATQLQATDYVTPIVLGDETKVQSLAQKLNLDISNIELINPATSEFKAELVQSFVERRKGKATEEQAQELLNNVNYFGTMLVYAGKSDEDPYENPHIKARLYPELPHSDYICFYPMNKRRNETYNWYMLTMEERQKLMYDHGMIGRKYAGKIKQFITGSVGFDDFEWGVTLFSDDVLQFKKIVYEMRFDETIARYGEFGSFFVGHIINTNEFDQFFAIS